MLPNETSRWKQLLAMRGRIHEIDSPKHATRVTELRCNGARPLQGGGGSHGSGAGHVGGGSSSWRCAQGAAAVREAFAGARHARRPGACTASMTGPLMGRRSVVSAGRYGGSAVPRPLAQGLARSPFRARRNATPGALSREWPRGVGDGAEDGARAVSPDQHRCVHPATCPQWQAVIEALAAAPGARWHC